MWRNLDVRNVGRKEREISFLFLFSIIVVNRVAFFIRVYTFTNRKIVIKVGTMVAWGGTLRPQARG